MKLLSREKFRVKRCYRGQWYGTIDTSLTMTVAHGNFDTYLNYSTRIFEILTARLIQNFVKIKISKENMVLNF